MIFDDPGTTTSTYVPERVFGVLGLALFGAGTIVFTVKAIRGGASSKTGRVHESSLAEMHRDGSAVPPAAVVPPDLLDGRIPEGRSWDWANAGARLAFACAGPLLLQLANGLLGEPLVGEDGVVLVWMFTLIMGFFFAGDAWHGELVQTTVGVDRDHSMLMGTTGWPVKRSRVLRIEGLSRVRFRRAFYGRALERHFVLRDADGTTVMVEDRPWVRVLVRDAVANGNVQVSYLASRELAGMFTWWSYPLALVRLMLLLMAGGAAGVIMASTFGLSL